MMTKLGKLFCLWASEWERELFGQEQISVQHKGCVDKGEKRYSGKWKKLCREQCETDSILQLDHTIQCFSSFIPYSFVSFVMIVCHFLGVLASVLRLARLYDCV